MSVVVPFLGSDAELAALREQLETIARRPGDELVVSDNREHPVRTPAFARNRGAERATGEWLVFIDADTVPDRGLLDAYFDPAPDELVGILAGGIRDEAPEEGGLLARYAVARAQMSHHRTLDRSGTPYAQTANCAIRRSAFVAAGGFEEHARAGEDADLEFRLMRAGWRLEARPDALVVHSPRLTLRGWLVQLLIHGSGARWLERRWPGELPRTPPARLLKRLLRHAADAAGGLAQGNPERTAFAVLDLLGAVAFEVGRLLPNHRLRRVWLGGRRGSAS